MIYIKEGDIYLKYHASDDGRLICTHRDGSESVILSDISSEFDGICESDGSLHFVLQSTGGELIYLKKEDGTWKKYSIFKSRSGLKKIHGLCLKKSAEKLCAFYIMEHGGKLLMVKHRFSLDNLYEEPEVLGITDARRDFCVCETQMKEFHIFYKDAEGERQEKILENDFSLKASGNHNLESDILSLRCTGFKELIYAVYTVPRKSSTALVFCDTKHGDDGKIITFGISRSCIPELITSGEKIIVQWEENGSIMQAESKNSGKTFTKPRSLGAGCITARVRTCREDDIKCDKCAVYNGMPYIAGIPLKESTSGEVKSKMTDLYKPNKSDITNPDSGNVIMEKLRDIETDIGKMGKSLFEICEFLDELKKFKTDTANDNFGFSKNREESKEDLSGKDIGEIDEDNIKLFKSTDIDSVLPENKD